jgi:glycogen debranching enzyme
MTLTILEGSTFCICDERGDIGQQTSGFFAQDTRFLSTFRMRVNGERPMLLSSRPVEYYSAAFYLRNPMNAGLAPDTLLIELERFVGQTMQDQLTITNESGDDVDFVLTLEFGSDFADILFVKSQDVAFGDPSGARRQPAYVRPTYDPANNQFLFEESGERAPRTQVILSRGGDVGEGVVTYRIELGPRARWALRIDVVPSYDGELAVPSAVERRFGDERRLIQDSLEAWRLRVPKLRTHWDDLGHSFAQSVADLAALRIRGRDGAIGDLPAAGMPWFMTVFGRDTIITCLQTLLFGPQLARSALEALAQLQAREDDPTIDAEPGKIVHEVRQGKAADVWHPAYYGTVDATPLYLVLLSEVWRWTGDARLVRQLQEPAMRALEWIDVYGDRDGDGFVEYERRADPGIKNQSWKDSDDSQMFADGTVAEPPIAAVEVQGYVYDAKRRVAELAREVWRDRALADRLEREASALYDAFNDAFWSDERGGYALALDRDKRQVDALCSNVGHLLWSEIVPAARVDAVVDQLMGKGLWSGWGVRTMSASEGGYNPLSYHNGTVWPHDNSLIAWGLTRYDRWEEARRIIRRMLEAANTFEYRLPEVFAGLARDDTPFPIAYPTAARPQAWAAGTPVLLLQLLLGLRPNSRHHALETVAPELPSWARGLRLSDVPAFGRTWDVRVDADDGRVHVSAA